MTTGISPTQNAVMGRSPYEDGSISTAQIETGVVVAEYHLARAEHADTQHDVYTFMGGDSAVHGKRHPQTDAEIIADIAIEHGLPPKLARRVGGGTTVSGYSEALGDNVLDCKKGVVLFAHGHHEARAKWITKQLFIDVDFVSAGNDDSRRYAAQERAGLIVMSALYHYHELKYIDMSPLTNLELCEAKIFDSTGAVRRFIK
jgi:hypothetical protein